MKKLIAIMLAVLMLATLCACGQTEAETPDTQAPATVIPEATEDVGEAETEPTEEVTETIPVAVTNADMALAESGVVCLHNFPKTGKDLKFFEAFKAQSTDYTVNVESIDVTVNDTTDSIECDIALRFSNKQLNQ